MSRKIGNIDLDKLEIANAYAKTAVVVGILSSYDFVENQGDRFGYEAYNYLEDQIEEFYPECDIDEYPIIKCIYRGEECLNPIELYFSKHWNMYDIGLGLLNNDVDNLQLNNFMYYKVDK